MAERGRECDLLTAWQSAAIRVQTLEQTRDWDNDRRQRIGDAINERVAAMACDDAGMTGWIGAASRGFDTEFLPPYLVVYRTLAQMDNPPMTFTAVALRHDFAAAIERIDAKFAELEASGAKAEGGKSWPDYIETTGQWAEQFVQRVNGEETERKMTMDEAAGWIAQSAMVTELWLAEDAATE